MKKGKEFLEFGTYAEKFPGINNKKISYYVCKATSENLLSIIGL